MYLYVFFSRPLYSTVDEIELSDSGHLEGKEYNYVLVNLMSYL